MIKVGKGNLAVLGAITGDVIGSVFEWRNCKSIDFPLFCADSRFTDDSVLSIAVADAILHQKDFAKTIWEYGNRFPDCGFGGRFKQWLAKEDLEPYGSYGNGSAMRVSAVGLAFDDLETVLKVAEETAAPTHNHPEGIKGAQAMAAAVFWARKGLAKSAIKSLVIEHFNYDLSFTLASIRPDYSFDVSCQGSVPQAIQAFLESNNFEEAIRLAISIGGDSDTIASMAGSLAAAYYQSIPDSILKIVLEKLPNDFIEILEELQARYA